MSDSHWGILRRQEWKEFKSLPADLQEIKDRLDSMKVNVPKQRPTPVPHAPHQQPRDECNQNECLGHGNVTPTDDNNYGKRIFGSK
jgi:hypothetical protein